MAADFEVQRESLISRLLAAGYVRDDKVAEALMSVRREEFVPEKQKTYAYDDRPLSIGWGQTISAPHMVAIMTQHTEARGASKVLEVGAGSGYQAAVLAEVLPDADIISVERVPELVSFAQENLKRCGYENVTVVFGDGTKGYPDLAPYDRILVTAAAPKVPDSLVEQLAEGGRMLIPVGGHFLQDLVAVEKKKGKIEKSSLGGCVFVPLIGEEGWDK
ncbi:protein-L-isoaspartate O-methyltransferase [Candidatus Altiarchaeota archaeon]